MWYHLAYPNFSVCYERLSCYKRLRYWLFGCSIPWCKKNYKNINKK